MTWVLDEKHKLPIYLPDKEAMTKEEFYAFCAANGHVRIERDENNEILIMPPVGGETGNKHIQVAFELESWNRQTKSGKTFDSSTGFELSDGSMRSPDASWIGNEKWNHLTPKDRKNFLPFAPDFVVEVTSSSNDITDAQKKMNKWIENGTRLGWLLVPAREHVSFTGPMERWIKLVGLIKNYPGRMYYPVSTLICQ